MQLHSLTLRTVACAAVLLTAASLEAQVPSIQTPPYARVARSIDSTSLDNLTSVDTVVFSQTLTVPQATWLQVLFGENCHLPGGSYIRMTSLDDGGVQRHRADTLVEWASVSALFNGDEVLLELVAGPFTRKNQIEIEALQFGFVEASPESICGNTDDRIRSFDDRQGRMFIGCTGWLIGLNATGTQDLMITAGHCVDSSATRIIEFNVPLSTSGGSVVRSNPDDQYPFVRGEFLNQTIGADWGVNTVGRNSNTGLLPTEANGGQYYNLGPVPSSPSGQTIRITGYGSVSLISPTLNLVQKTHTGGMQNGANPTALRYGTDTTGGNSGSPVIHENSGNVIGVHTHAGCSSSGGGNQGTRIDRSDFESAIADAQRIQGAATVFGTGCGVAQTSCASVNPNGGSLTGAFRNNEYAYRFTVNSNATIDSFDIFTASNGGNTAVTARLYADNNGIPGAVLAQGTLSVGAAQAFYTATLPPTNVGPGTYYVAVNHSAQTTMISTLSSGQSGVAFWQRPGRSWSQSGLVQRPSFRVSCQAGTTAFSDNEPRIDTNLVTNLASGEASQPASLLTGLSNTTFGGSTPLPFSLDLLGAVGCSLYVDPLISSSATTNSVGSAQIALPVPNDTNLIGLHIYQQWAILAPSANSLGVVTSNGLDNQLGN